MSKSSSYSSRDGGEGRKNTFKKNDSFKSSARDAKPFKKKNYDGRPPASGAPGEDRHPRGAKPYSGRVTDSDKPKRTFEQKSGSWNGADSKPRKEFDKPRRPDNDSKPFRDRPKRNFDKSAFNSDKNDGGEFKPRREFDKPKKPYSDSKPFRDRPMRNFDKPAFNSDKNDGGEFKPRREFDKPKKPYSDSKPFRDRPKRNFDKPVFNDDKNERGEFKPRKEFDSPRKHGTDSRPFRDRPKRPGNKPTGKDVAKRNAESGSLRSHDDKVDAPELEKPGFADVLDRAFHPPKPKKKEDHPGKRQVFEDKVFGELQDPVPETTVGKPFEKKRNEHAGKKVNVPKQEHAGGRKKKYKEDEEEADEEEKEISQKSGPRLEMPLNKYIAHSGECSRRDAAELVKQGKVKVNGELILEPGYKVKHDDKVTLSGKKLALQKGMVYILLNKPKGFITTNDDPQGRRTVMELVGNSGVDRLFPVGRLDRDTSGLLLITNDGDLTQKLCHPAFEIKKVYQVTLDKPLTNSDFDKIIEGVELEDGIAKVDEMAYLEKKNELGLEIHSGRNRIVRRIFESLGYVVNKLDRVMYAGLTKKNLPRSKWRYLDEREVVLLKHFKS